jgi:hypothetical protein
MSANYTEGELKKFRKLVNGVSSRDQMERINSRLDMRRFVDRVGKEKCDAMFAQIEKEDAK